MQKVIIQEQVTIWQDVCLSFPDDIDISTKEKLVEAINKDKWVDSENKNVFLETEEHQAYDFTSVQYL